MSSDFGFWGAGKVSFKAGRVSIFMSGGSSNSERVVAVVRVSWRIFFGGND